MLFNIATLAIALSAVIVSVIAIDRQSRLSRSSGNMQFTVEILLRDIRTREFQSNLRFVLLDLARHHDSKNGISNLPVSAQQAAWNVAAMYETIGIMLALNMVDRRIVLSIARYRICRTWEILHPYIEAERKIRGDHSLPFFENAYILAQETDAAKIYESLALRCVDGRKWSEISMYQPQAKRDGKLAE